MLPKSTGRTGLQNNQENPRKIILVKVLQKWMALDLCSALFGVRWRDAGRAFSVFKPVKKKVAITKGEQGGLFSLG